MRTVIKVEDLGKLYDLGEVGTGTASRDLSRWWARVRGKEDPFQKVGQLNDRTRKAAKNDIVWALKGVNFEVQEGEVMGIIGRNGAGKSTLLKIISQITAPSSGSVKIKGRIASLLEVGTGFHPEMTGRENVYMNGTILGMSRREITQKLDDILEFAGVAKYVDTPVKRYSSGMQVRLGFAVAAFLEPEILIVDEVLAVGDAEFQKKAIGKMKEVSQSGRRTVLFVSHNMDSVKSLCERTLLLENGSVKMDGQSAEVIGLYTSSQEIYQEIDNGSFRISGFRIMHKAEGRVVESGSVPFGSDFQVEFNVRINDFTQDKKLYFALTLRNKHGQKITTLDNLYSDQPIVFGEDREITVRCKVSSNYLIPAEYFLELWGGNLFETYLPDRVIGKMEIVFSNYFGNGKLHSEHQHGNVWLPNEWHKL